MVGQHGKSYAQTSARACVCVCAHARAGEFVCVCDIRAAASHKLPFFVFSHTKAGGPYQASPVITFGTSQHAQDEILNVMLLGHRHREPFQNFPCLSVAGILHELGSFLQESKSICQFLCRWYCQQTRRNISCGHVPVQADRQANHVQADTPWPVHHMQADTPRFSQCCSRPCEYLSACSAAQQGPWQSFAFAAAHPPSRS